MNFGDFDRALGTLQDAVESQGHVRRIAELWFAFVVVRQCPEARTARADVDVETEHIGAGPKLHLAVRDTPIEERRAFALHIEQMADVEPACLDVPPAARRILQLANRKAGLWLDQRELEILAANACRIPGSGRRAHRKPCRAQNTGGANGESHATGIRDCDHVGVQSRSVAEVEIEVREAQERPHTDAYRTDSDNHSMTHGCGLDALTDRALEHRFQQHHGQACDQRRGDRSSEPPPSSAGSKRSH